ncbi:hypothetical protein [Brevibacterium jeotgali]|uniref:ABC-2 type transport system permease protein n=1 Tax=Brevibacterium jeotgali TaxID=1262550 RepID=A0A2H1L772_9MICO|nr:hypothetical protein [Brevibacterium jeotgali]TWC02705.1 hypothetical protein FB108_1389 [Brevibacterium jeotgali]SMY12615.1 hypothetical protein BJEO58_02214 [Brevibacterium jeotgali]
MNLRSALPSRVHRAARPQAASGSGWYAVYASVLVGTVVGMPLVRGAALGLGQPSVLPLLEAPPVALLSVGFAAIVAVATVVGGTAGPAVLSPFLTVHLGGNHLSRARTLLRPFLLSAVVLVSACLLVAGTVGWTLWSADAVDGRSAVMLLLTAACGAWIVSVFWLVGQVCTARTRTALVLAVGVVGTAASLPPVSLSPVPWSATVAGAVLWTVCALLSALTVPRLLVRLRGDDLLNHARRRDLAAAAGTSGEIGHALSTFRPLPRVGRGLSAVRARVPFILTIVRRDIVGALRTPVRGAVGLAGVLASGALIVLSFAMPAGVMWAAAAAAAIVGFASLGVVSDGFRYAAAGAGRPPLHGVSTARLMAAHGALPALLVVLAAAVGVGVGILAGAPVGAVPGATACLALLGLVRACDSARGPLPVRLLTPVQSPVGDFAGAAVALWQVEAVVLSLGITIGLSYAVSASLWTLGAVPLVGCALVLRTRRRLRS